LLLYAEDTGRSRKGCHCTCIAISEDFDCGNHEPGYEFSHLSAIQKKKWYITPNRENSYSRNHTFNLHRCGRYDCIWFGQKVKHRFYQTSTSFDTKSRFHFTSTSTSCQLFVIRLVQLKDVICHYFNFKMISVMIFSRHIFWYC
jgi:hypothetical protein